MPETPRFEVRHPEIEKHLKGIGATIAGVLPKGIGFTLLLFEFSEEGGMYYMSNAQRKDMIKALEEFLEKQKSSA